MVTKAKECNLFNGILTFLGYLMPNPSFFFLEGQLWYYLTHSWEDKGVHTFPKSICPKVNVIARLEYKLAYYDSAVHCFNHYTTGTPSKNVMIGIHTHPIQSVHSAWHAGLPFVEDLG